MVSDYTGRMPEMWPVRTTEEREHRKYFDLRESVDRKSEKQKLIMEKRLLKDTIFNEGGQEIEKENGHFGSHSG
jgi:hypothetical protein